MHQEILLLLNAVLLLSRVLKFVGVRFSEHFDSALERAHLSQQLPDTGVTLLDVTLLACSLCGQLFDL